MCKPMWAQVAVGDTINTNNVERVHMTDSEPLSVEYKWAVIVYMVSRKEIIYHFKTKNEARDVYLRLKDLT